MSSIRLSTDHLECLLPEVPAGLKAIRLLASEEPDENEPFMEYQGMDLLMVYTCGEDEGLHQEVYDWEERHRNLVHDAMSLVNNPSCRITFLKVAENKEARYKKLLKKAIKKSV